MLMNRKWFLLLVLGIVLAAAGVYLGTTRIRPQIPPQPAAANGAVETAAATDALHFRFDGPAGADGVPAPWQPKVSGGRLQVEVRSREGPPDKRALWVRSQKASYFLANAAQPFDPAEYPYLSWSWKAVLLPTGGDVRQHNLLFGSNRNDQALQVLVAFEGNTVLSYVWDTTAPVDTEVDEPSLAATVKTHVVDSGAAYLNQWRDHKINIYNDYTRRFGKPPGRVVGVLVQTNANHTASVGEGFFGEITASPQ
jgi:Protein of unknown function (DUF3047)